MNKIGNIELYFSPFLHNLQLRIFRCANRGRTIACRKHLPRSWNRWKVNQSILELILFDCAIIQNDILFSFSNPWYRCTGHWSVCHDPYHLVSYKKPECTDQHEHTQLQYDNVWHESGGGPWNKVSWFHKLRVEGIGNRSWSYGNFLFIFTEAGERIRANPTLKLDSVCRERIR